jgi:hypothetical protein
VKKKKKKKKKKDRYTFVTQDMCLPLDKDRQGLGIDLATPSTRAGGRWSFARDCLLISWLLFMNPTSARQTHPPKDEGIKWGGNGVLRR